MLIRTSQKILFYMYHIITALIATYLIILIGKNTTSSNIFWWMILLLILYEFINLHFYFLKKIRRMGTPTLSFIPMKNYSFSLKKLIFGKAFFLCSFLLCMVLLSGDILDYFLTLPESLFSSHLINLFFLGLFQLLLYNNLLRTFKNRIYLKGICFDSELIPWRKIKGFTVDENTYSFLCIPVNGATRGDLIKLSISQNDSEDFIHILEDNFVQNYNTSGGNYA